MNIDRRLTALERAAAPCFKDPAEMTLGELYQAARLALGDGRNDTIRSEVRSGAEMQTLAQRLRERVAQERSP